VADSSAGFAKDGDRVLLRGKIGRGTGLKVFTLPAGHRPGTELQFQVESASGGSVVTVTAGGDVLADPNEKWVSFDGISFEAH